MDQTSPILDQFNDLADKYAALTEVEDNIQNKRKALFDMMVATWAGLTPSQKAEATGHLVNLNKQSKLSLPNESTFVGAFKEATIKNNRR